MQEPVIAEITIFPLGTENPSLSRYISACLNVVKQTPNINYQLTAMGTIIQGRLEQVLELAQRMHELPFTMGAKRVMTIISIDDRRDKPVTIESKVAAVTK